jgi:hypothetical protein
MSKRVQIKPPLWKREKLQKEDKKNLFCLIKKLLSSQAIFISVACIIKLFGSSFDDRK